MAGKICINHRRGDDPGFTQALYQVLEQEFSAGDLFTDVEGQIKPGDDFVAVLNRRVAPCDALLVVIGPRWADLLAQRAGAEDDFVAIEIKAALDQGKRLIPVLVGGAAMPRAATLPESIRALASRHAVGLRPEHFKADCQGLVAALKEQLAAMEQKPALRTLGERMAAEAQRQKREAEEAAGGMAATGEAEARGPEELANWVAIKGRDDAQALRDHLARFPHGVTARLALAKLEELAWTGLGPSPDMDALEAFLDEFPKGTYSPTARAELAIRAATPADFNSLLDTGEMPATVRGRAHGRPFRARADPAAGWRYYVDVLSALVLVVTFLLSVFMVAQFYVSHESSGKDTVLRRLQRQIAELTYFLSFEKEQNQSFKDELLALQASFATLRSDSERLTGMAGLGGEKDARIAALTKELSDKASLSSEAQAKVDLLNLQVAQLRQQMAALQEAINAHEAKDKDSQARIADLGARLNVVLLRRVQELQRYRSDFFGRLRELLRDRKDIRVVGDRFVFESEVLFPPGQAHMAVEGLAAIDQLATAILELERTIPREVDWALQVDGHTDIRPIENAPFPSNWELSSARATTVVKYLIMRGVSPRRLVAAGYGEFQPLEEGLGDDVLRRNRRIELKLTNR